MFANSLVFTTLVATLYAVSGVNAADLNAKNPVNPVQCKDTTLEWTGGQGPYNVYVFTDCKDDSDAPIATFTNVAGNSVSWPTTLYSGDGFFFQVEDATGKDSFSDDAYLGGDADKIDECKKEVAALKASDSASIVSSTQSPAPSVSAAAVGDDNIPTTMSRASTTTTPGASGVANAASDPSGGANQKAGSDKVANGASTLVARPVELALGVLAAGVVAFL
ncbi:hypothetical protein M407DRAFT_240671 [Tulasnella calospora MUT 4182]|uniref:Uncharacterized protein n=1 Tax=Tulasnella calospora MUT 4182 TaxID=1051891 RepID=A0A0C3QWS9_9AGAM|nr:hypothetical protein M407DRAFT_240671 [Tulasnella calospora MUT 4182]